MPPCRRHLDTEFENIVSIRMQHSTEPVMSMMTREFQRRARARTLVSESCDVIRAARITWTQQAQRWTLHSEL